MDPLRVPSMPSQLDLDSVDVFPRDYDKDLQDHLKHTFVCECISFIIVLIPHRDPLRLVYVDRFEPKRIETPRWIDAWEEYGYELNYTSCIIDLDRISSSMKKLSVFRHPPIQEDDGTTFYALKWATIHAQSGMFEKDDEIDGCDDSEDEVD